MKPRGLFLLLLFAAVFSGCVATDAFNKHYDLSRVRRVGVLTFDYGENRAFGAEDIFAKHLLERGYQLVERSRLEAVLAEQKLSVSGLLANDGSRDLGKILGVDALLLGQVTAYEPERKTLVTVMTHTAQEDPVFEDVNERQEDGSYLKKRKEVGKKVTRKSREVPMLVPIDAEVGLAVKLVDVKSGEVIWIGSETSQGINAAYATETISAYLVRRLAKNWNVEKSASKAAVVGLK